MLAMEMLAQELPCALLGKTLNFLCAIARAWLYKNSCPLERTWPHTRNGLIMMTLAFILLLVFAVVGAFAAYRNGVRDGYQNIWLPHVQDQVKKEGLVQGQPLEGAIIWVCNNCKSDYGTSQSMCISCGTRRQ